MSTLRDFFPNEAYHFNDCLSLKLKDKGFSTATEIEAHYLNESNKYIEGNLDILAMKKDVKYSIECQYGKLDSIHLNKAPQQGLFVKANHYIIICEAPNLILSTHKTDLTIYTAKCNGKNLKLRYQGGPYLSEFPLEYDVEDYIKNIKVGDIIEEYPKELSQIILYQYVKGEIKSFKDLKSLKSTILNESIIAIEDFIKNKVYENPCIFPEKEENNIFKSNIQCFLLNKTDDTSCIFSFLKYLFKDKTSCLYRTMNNFLWEILKYVPLYKKNEKIKIFEASSILLNEEFIKKIKDYNLNITCVVVDPFEEFFITNFVKLQGIAANINVIDASVNMHDMDHYDLTLGNPPWNTKNDEHCDITWCAIKFSDLVIMLMPNNFLKTNSNNRHNRYRNTLGKYISGNHDLTKEEIASFDIAYGGSVGIMSFNKDNSFDYDSLMKDNKLLDKESEYLIGEAKNIQIELRKNITFMEMISLKNLIDFNNQPWFIPIGTHGANITTKYKMIKDGDIVVDENGNESKIPNFKEIIKKEFKFNNKGKGIAPKTREEGLALLKLFLSTEYEYTNIAIKAGCGKNFRHLLEFCRIPKILDSNIIESYKRDIGDVHLSKLNDLAKKAISFASRRELNVYSK
jgi:hypothetical protein